MYRFVAAVIHARRERERDLVSPADRVKLFSSGYEWTALFVGLVDCDVYSYKAVSEGDPFCDECNLWSFNYFFYNRKLKRILYFSCRAVSKTANEDSDEDGSDGDGRGYGGVDDSFVDDMDMDMDY